MLIVSCVEFIPLQLPITVSFKVCPNQRPCPMVPIASRDKFPTMRCAHALFSYTVTGTYQWGRRKVSFLVIDKSTTWCACVNVSCLKSVLSSGVSLQRGSSVRVGEYTVYSLASRAGKAMFCHTVEPPRTHVTKLYTPCYLCNDVVREGLRRFDVLEPPRTSSQHPAYLVAAPVTM